MWVYFKIINKAFIFIYDRDGRKVYDLFYSELQHKGLIFDGLKEIK